MNSITRVLLTGATALSLASQAFAQVASPPAPVPVAVPDYTPVMATDGAGVSTRKLAIVRVVRHQRSDKDPLSKYGAGFYVAVFNKGRDPLVVNPDNIVVKDRNGRVMTILTQQRIEELKKAEADRAAAFGAFMSVGLAALGGVAAARPNTAASGALLQQDAMTVLTVSNNNANAIASEKDALVAAYNTNPFIETNTPPLSAATGRILVEKMNDREPAVVLVTLGDEVHEVHFDTQSR